MQNSTSHIGLPFAAEHFTDPAAAVERVREIYDANTAYLRDCFKRFSAGEDIQQRVHACYPFVRVHTEIGTRVDTRLSYGFVGGTRHLCHDGDPAGPVLALFPGAVRAVAAQPQRRSGSGRQPPADPDPFRLPRRPACRRRPDAGAAVGDARQSSTCPTCRRWTTASSTARIMPGAGRADAAGAVHRPARGLLAPPAEALHRDIAGPFPELRAVHQLPVLYRRVHPARHGDHVADRRSGRSRNTASNTPPSSNRATSSSRTRTWAAPTPRAPAWCACRRCRPTT